MAKTASRGPYRKNGRKSARRNVLVLGAVAPHFIKSYRLKMGWTIERLAEKTGLAVGSISAIERGEQWPQEDTLQKLATALRTTRGQLLDVDPAPDKDN
jgi:ribosome-binding protein aMBF1 (putative translation factor)